MPETESKRAKVIGWLVLGLGLCAVLELLAYAGLQVIDQRLGLSVRDFPPYTPAYYDRFTSPDFFHPEIGWDPTGSALPTRGGQADVTGETYFSSSYGDSMTWCNEVADDETFQHYFEEEYGKRILNLGISAGSQDMAYWKCREYFAQYPSRIVLFGLTPENVNRLGSVVRKFLAPDDDYPLVKPRFAIDDRGEIVYIPNPIQRPGGVRQLAEHAFLKNHVAPGDYWYQQFRGHYGYDLVTGRSFPYLFELGQLAVGQALHGPVIMDYHYHCANPASELYPLQFHVLDAFLELAEHEGFTPVFMIHCIQQDLGREDFLEPTFDYLEARGLDYFRVGRALLEASEQRGIAIEELYQPGGHYSPRANRIIAKALHAFLAEKGYL